MAHNPALLKRYSISYPSGFAGTLKCRRSVQTVGSLRGSSMYSTITPPCLVTEMAAGILLNGNGLARRILADPELEGDPLAFLKAQEAFWKAMKQQKHEPHKKGPTVITVRDKPYQTLLPAKVANSTTTLTAASQQSVVGSTHDYDVIMCGGTLGIVVALALQRQGFRVAVVERRRVEGRSQEWNSSRHEAQVLVDVGLMTQSELESTIVTEFNPVRVGFKGGSPMWVNDCLNIGMSPKDLVAILRTRFEAAGGVIYEHTAFKTAVVCPDGVVVTLAESANAPADIGDTNRPNALGKQPQQRSQKQQGAVQAAAGKGSSSGSKARQSLQGGSDASGPGSKQAPTKLSCRLVLDCMGHYSSIVKQIRGKAKPEGMVLVVGGCATGFQPEHNQTADLLYSMTDASADMQLFWEAFPAEGGKARTTYMFAYSDAEPSRPNFEQLLDTYFTLLPSYQNIPNLQNIKFKRVLFGGFPCFSKSPLKPGFDRVLQLGDASASQSPLSFGGFGSLLRHLPRLSQSIGHALRADRLTKGDLAWIHPYQPSLSASWLFQRSMSIGVGQLQQSEQHQQEQEQEQEKQPVAAAASQQPQKIKPAITGAALDAAAVGDVQVAVNNAVAFTARQHMYPVTASSTGRLLEASGRRGGSNNSDRANSISASAEIGSTGVLGKVSRAAAFAASSTATTAGNNGTNSSYSIPAAVPSVSKEQQVGSANIAPSKASTNTNTTSSSSDVAATAAASQPSWLRRRLLLPPNHINALLGANFTVMSMLGLRVLKPFLQDTLQLGPLGITMLGMMLVKPLVISRVLFQVGAKVLVGWFAHFVALTAYTLGHFLLKPFRRCSDSYTFHRLLDALEYGSGNDYKYHASKPVSRAEAAAATGAAMGSEPTGWLNGTAGVRQGASVAEASSRVNWAT